MPWRTSRVFEQRFALIHAVRTAGVPVAAACRRFGVSRKTAYKWLSRYGEDQAAALVDRSRAPVARPRRTGEDLARRILELRAQFGWGARKLHADLRGRGVPVPSVRTVHAVLERAGVVTPPAPVDTAPTRFERARCNELWQVDFKSFLEVDRARLEHLTILDDHSRYLLAFTRVPDLSMASAWRVLWKVFGEVGLPESLLSDNAFGSTRSQPRTLSWFDCRLIRLGIRPLHGRPYHPQTQGKVERVHGSLERECFPRARKDDPVLFERDCAAWRQLYNHRRPHEALGDQPPITRWQKSPRVRPRRLPEIVYPAGTHLRRVATSGDVHFKAFRLVAGKGLAGQWVALEEHDHEIVLRYSTYTLRRIPTSALVPSRLV